MKFLYTLLILFLLGSFTMVHADLAGGIAALERNDFATAAKEFKPLAEKGDVNAQLQLGYLYYHGKGVKQDYKRRLNG